MDGMGDWLTALKFAKIESIPGLERRQACCLVSFPLCRVYFFSAMGVIRDFFGTFSASAPVPVSLPMEIRIY